MKLSIITINLNNVDGLKKTVDSVMSQTWRDFEWIIVDGGSTDGSKELIEELASNPQSNISWWCSEKDQGIYNAMNKGIGKATSDYSLFLNSGDCLFAKDVLLKVLQSDIEADIIYGDAEMICLDGTSYTKIMPDVVSVDFFFRDTIIHQSTFVKNTVFLEFPYDECLRVASDRKLWFQCLLAEKSFAHLPFRVCSFDLSGIGTIGNMKEEEKVIIEELFPKAVQKSIRELADYKYTFPQLPRLISQIKHRRLYKRLVLRLLFLFEWLRKT